MSSAVCGSACCRGTTTHAVPTSHSIVGEPLTELIPHNEEHGEWKGSQLAKLLHAGNNIYIDLLFFLEIQVKVSDPPPPK